MERINNLENGVEISFLDKRNNFLKLTCRLFSSKEENCFSYCINGETHTTHLFGKTKINDTYRYIFYIYLEKSLLNEKLTVDFCTDIRTGHFFPIEKSLNGFYQIEESILYSENNSLVFEPYNSALFKSRKKLYKKSLFKLNKTAIIALAIRFFYKLLKPFYKKDIWLISDRIDKAGDNGESFFEYAVKNAPKNVRCVFLLDKKSKDYSKIKKIGMVKSPTSPFYKIYYTLAKVHISSQLDGSRLLRVRSYLKDILNRQKTVFLQHGVTKDNISSYYNRFDFGIDMFVTTVYEERKSIIETENYGCDGEIVKMCGFARYDKLENCKEKIIFIVPTWRLSLLEDTETLKIKDGFENSKYFKFYNSLLHSEKLITKAKEKGYKLCFYPHSMMRNAQKYFENLDPVFANPNNYTYTDMFKFGSLIVTDYSSIQFDFAYLRKPLIYCHFDKEEFFSSHTYVEGYFNYERDGFGPVLYSIDDTVNAICHCVDNDCAIQKEYEERIEKTFKFNDKNNCKRTLEEILTL